MLFKGKKEAKRLEMILKDYTSGGSHPLFRKGILESSTGSI